MSDNFVSKILPDIDKMPTHSEILVLRAEQGEKLVADERRDAVAYLTVVRPDMGHMELGRLFQVSDTTIREDKEKIRKRMAEELTSDDIGLVINDIRRSYEHDMVELARSTKACTYGTNNWLAHVKAKRDFEKQYIEMLQSLGFYPKNLGNISKTQFIFKAVVAKGGGVNTVAVENPKELTALIVSEQKALPAAAESEEDKDIRDALEAEFSGRLEGS